MGQIALAAVVTTVLIGGAVSCRNDYTTAFLFTVGSQYNQLASYRVSYETGKLTAAPGSPYGSGGTNPVRVLVLSGGRYIYVLNNGAEQTDSSGNISYSGANISVFNVGGYGNLAFQTSYSSQGSNTTRILTDSSGKFLFALDTFVPVIGSSGTFTSNFAPQANPSSTYPCQGSDGKYYPTGGITVFSIDGNTGRLSIVTNQQQQAQTPNGPVQLTYFPVGCFPVDFTISGGYVLTADAGSSANGSWSGDLQTVFPYQLNSTNGQLTLTQNSALAMGTVKMTAISTAQGSNLTGSKYVYILDSGTNNGSGTILPFTVGSNGILQAIAQGATANTSTAANPTALIVDSQTKYLFIANSGPTSGIVNPISQITGWNIDSTSGALTPISGQPFGSGSGVDCILEDTSNQYIYTTSFNDSQITGRILDPKSGSLTLLRRGSTFNTVGNPTWCAVSGRTN
jgi:6-phosphogluconolactonase (cycloisomerase 2 family)